MASFLSKYFFAALSQNYHKFEKPIEKVRVHKIDFDDISSKNRIRIHKLRYNKNKVNKFDELYLSIRDVERLIRFKQQNNLISRELATKYLSKTAKMLEFLSKKRSNVNI